MKEKKIERLYHLLENGKLDDETRAALRWAIFELEQSGLVESENPDIRFEEVEVEIEVEKFRSAQPPDRTALQKESEEFIRYIEKKRSENKKC